MVICYMKNRIVTLYPYSPTFTHEYRVTNLVYYLSRMFDTEPAFLMTNRFIPIKAYLRFELEKSFFLLRSTQHMYKNILWLAAHSPFSPLVKIVKKFKRSNLGISIFDFFDDDYLNSRRYGESYCPENKDEYYNALKTLFDTSLTLFIHEGHKNFYENEGLVIGDNLILPNASDPNLFKNSPLPPEKVVGHIGSFKSMEAAKSRGLFLLLDAFEFVQKEYTDAKLLLAGAFGNDVKALVKKRISGWKTEIYWERIPNYWVPEVFAKCYLFVRPTLQLRVDVKKDSKLMGSASGLDAAASARPVVATNQNAIINDNGYLCEPEPKDMAEKICRLLSDRALASKLAQRGRKAIEQEHNWENRARVLYDYLVTNYDLERPDKILRRQPGE